MRNIRIKTFGKAPNGEPAYTTGKFFIRESKEYEPLRPGEIVALEDDEVDLLMETRDDFIEITTKAPNRASPPPRHGPVVHPDEPVPVDEEVVGVMRDMDLTDGNLWTSDSVPRVDYLEKTLGRNVSAEVRDVCWEFVLEERRKADEGEGEGTEGDEGEGAEE